MKTENKDSIDIKRVTTVSKLHKVHFFQVLRRYRNFPLTGTVIDTAKSPNAVVFAVYRGLKKHSFFVIFILLRFFFHL